MKVKSLLLNLPEYSLLLLVLLAGYSPPFSFNPVFIGIALILVLQLILKNNLFGLILGVLYFLANLFFLGALISELGEFTSFSTDSGQLALVGFPLWVVTITLASTMIYKYSLAAFSQAPEASY